MVTSWMMEARLKKHSWLGKAQKNNLVMLGTGWDFPRGWFWRELLGMPKQAAQGLQQVTSLM